MHALDLAPTHSLTETARWQVGSYPLSTEDQGEFYDALRSGLALGVVSPGSDGGPTSH